MQRHVVLDPGEALGNYHILARLRAGGMGALYLGRRSGAAGFARHVAIKVLRPELADDPAAIRMFVEEARLAARIDHPNVVHVDEFEEARGTYFLVMGYVHGCSLAQFVQALKRRSRTFAPEEAVAIALQAADGLHAAHETRGENGEVLGVVHRDVSPQNLLLSFDGHVKLIDFGIAKITSRAPLTRSGSLKGKLQYMSPEQAARRAVDRRTDVYALGIVLWELLTARRLFTADDEIELLESVRSPSVEPPSRIAKDVGEALDSVVMTALATDPSARYSTAIEFRSALASALPSALAVDSQRLARLIAEVMPDEIAAADRILGEASAAGAHASSDALTATATVHHHSSAASDSGSSESRPERTPARTSRRRAVIAMCLAIPLCVGAIVFARGTWPFRARGAHEARVLPLPNPSLAPPSADERLSRVEQPTTPTPDASPALTTLPTAVERTAPSTQAAHGPRVRPTRRVHRAHAASHSSAAGHTLGSSVIDHTVIIDSVGP